MAFLTCYRNKNGTVLERFALLCCALIYFALLRFVHADVDCGEDDNGNGDDDDDDDDDDYDDDDDDDDDDEYDDGDVDDDGAAEANVMKLQ